MLGAIVIFAAIAAVDTARRALAGRRQRISGAAVVAGEPGVHEHPHRHGEGCGHEVVEHDGHRDYLHDGHLHSPHEDHYDEHDVATGRIAPVGVAAPSTETGAEDAAGGPR